MICCTSTVGVDSSWPATSGTSVADGGGTAAIPGAPVSDPFGQTNHTAIIAITVPTIPSITFLSELFEEAVGTGSGCGVVGCVGPGCCAWSICRYPGPVVGRMVDGGGVDCGPDRGGDVVPDSISRSTVSKSGTLSTGRVQHFSRYFVSLATVGSGESFNPLKISELSGTA